MASSSRIQVGVLVTAITLLVCSLGVRHELNVAKGSIAAHRLIRLVPDRQAPE